MWFSLAMLAAAAPPSAVLTGPAGELRWTVTETATGLSVDGRSPTWSVHHECAADFTPRRTVRTGADGATTRIEYDAGGATVTSPSGRVRVDLPGLWDGDVLDVRLGAWSAGHTTALAFSAVDGGSGKVYGFDATYRGEAQRGGVACRAWRVQLAGIYRLVGPTWEYCYAAGGRLVWFSGPIGVFEVAR